jgi:hypothetical protein
MMTRHYNTMKIRRLTRQLGFVVGGAAVVGMIGFTAACGTEGEDVPESTAPTTTTTAPSETPRTPVPVDPTEKSINPTGGNLFTPSVKAPGPRTAIPGNRENSG